MAIWIVLKPRLRRKHSPVAWKVSCATNHSLDSYSPGYHRTGIVVTMPYKAFVGRSKLVKRELKLVSGAGTAGS